MWASGPLQAAEKVGKTELIVKKVTGELAQTQRLLALKDTVFQNELIAAGTASASRIVFLDGTELAVGPNTEITLDRFVFDPDEGSVSVKLNVIEGVFRFISGRFANAFKSDYEIKTPTATLGMRGTVVTAVVAPDGTTATKLDSPSIVTVQGLTGEIVTLDVAGISATSMPDGTISPPGPFPDWAREAVRQMDMLLADAFDVDTLDHEATPAPPGVAPEAPSVSPPAPPAPPAPPPPDPEPSLDGLGLSRAHAVANDHAISGGLGDALSVGDANAQGTVDHGHGVGSGGAADGAAAAGSNSGAGGPNGTGAGPGANSGGGHGGENAGGKGGGKGAGGKGGGNGAANAGGPGGNGNGNGK